MTVYGPDITDAFEAYSTVFDDLRVNERTPIIDLNAINPLSSLRENWQNATTEPSEHHLSTTASTNEIAYLETSSAGQYTAGYSSEAGLGVRIPSAPTQDGEMRWGFYETDSNDEPYNGWYFGVDSSGVFVAEVDQGSETKVYQGNWNLDNADGTDDAEVNPSGFDLDLSKGNIFQIEFVYYGYGPVRMHVLTDDGIVNLHKFTHDGKTSISNTNLPLTVQIDNNSTSSDANDLYVGGRQFSVIGEETTNSRKALHYRATSQTIDDTQWHPIMSIKLKDGTDIGSIDFTHIFADIAGFQVDTDNTTYRWQIRRGTTPNSPTWESPESHAETPDETAMKVDTSSTDIGTGAGITGVFVDGGTLASGSNNNADLRTQDPSGTVIGEEVVTLLVKASAGSSGTLSEITFSWTENW